MTGKWQELVARATTALSLVKLPLSEAKLPTVFMKEPVWVLTALDETTCAVKTILFRREVYSGLWIFLLEGPATWEPSKLFTVNEEISSSRLLLNSFSLKIM